LVGYDTRATTQLYEKRVAKLKPTIVIIGLSIANEGVNEVTFMNNMTILVKQIKDNGAICIVAGVYPNNFYSERMIPFS
jgi:hypothetical protein